MERDATPLARLLVIFGAFGAITVRLLITVAEIALTIYAFAHYGFWRGLAALLVYNFQITLILAAVSIGLVLLYGILNLGARLVKYAYECCIQMITPPAFTSAPAPAQASHAHSDPQPARFDLPRPAPTRRASGASPQSYRQPILRAVGYDDTKVDRLIALERAVTPHATDEELHQTAYERWLRDNR